MLHNLVPPFVIRREGNLLNDIPKMQVDDPNVDDHSLYFPEAEVRIHMQLIGTVSFFSTRIPTEEEIAEAVEKDVILDLNTDEPEWDPHNPSYAREEECMLDFEGNLVEESVRDRRILPVDDHMKDNISISAVRIMEHEDTVCISAVEPGDDSPSFIQQHGETTEVLHSISGTLDPETFANSLTNNLAASKFKESVGAVYSSPDYVVGRESQSSLSGMQRISAVYTDNAKGVSAAKLAKVFQIDLSTAKKTLMVTSQRLKKGERCIFIASFPFK